MTTPAKNSAGAPPAKKPEPAPTADSSNATTSGTTAEASDPNKGKSQAELDKEAAAQATSGQGHTDHTVEVGRIEGEADIAQRQADSKRSQADALIQQASVAGSPVTPGTVASTDTSAAANATNGNFSPTTVAEANPNSPVHLDADGKPIDPPETISDEEADHLDRMTGQATNADDPNAIPAKPENRDDAGEVRQQEARGAAVRVNRLLELHADRKDDYTIYGYGGVTITIDDLRKLVAATL